MTLNTLPDNVLPDEPSEDESSGAEEGSYDIMSYDDELDEEEEDAHKETTDEDDLEPTTVVSTGGLTTNHAYNILVLMLFDCISATNSCHCLYVSTTKFTRT